MKQYTLTVVISEGSDEFWEEFADKSGADEVLELVRQALHDRGFQYPGCRVSVAKFEQLPEQSR